MLTNLKSIINKIITKSLVSDKGKPGELIEKLPKEEREILKTAKSKDFNHRI